MGYLKSPLRELSLFTGAGGGLLAGRLLGWQPVCAIESDALRQAILVARQNDGSLSPFPIWDDISTFDGRPWLGLVDVISGGFPCQDISIAGQGVGIDGSRSGLWAQMARVVAQVRPQFVFVENSPMLVSRGLARVLGDLASLRYDAVWGVLGASEVGAWHLRERIWILAADSYQIRWQTGSHQEASSTKQRSHADRSSSDAGNSGGSFAIVGGYGEAEAHAHTHASSVSNEGPRGHRQESPAKGESIGEWERHWVDLAQPSGTGRGGFSWPAEPDMVRMVHGIPDGVDRVAALGDSQVPICAAVAFVRLFERLEQMWQEKRQQ